MSHVKFLLLHILSFISGSVLLPHPEKNPLASWGCALLLCKQRHSTHLSYHGIVVPGKSPVKLPAHSHALTLWLNQHVAFGCSSLASPYIIDIALTCFFFFPLPSGASWRGLFPLHCLQWWECVWGQPKGNLIPLQPLPTFLRPPHPFIHLNIKSSSAAYSSQSEYVKCTFTTHTLPLSHPILSLLLCSLNCICLPLFFSTVTKWSHGQFNF